MLGDPAAVAAASSVVARTPTPETPATKSPASPKTAVKKTTTSKKPSKQVEPAAASAAPAPTASASAGPAPTGPAAVTVRGLTKRYDGRAVVDGADLVIPSGSLYGFVGPNGAGKTTTLAMVTGMLRPDEGEVLLHDLDVWRNSREAKKQLGTLPDRLRLFDRLTGVEFLHHAGALRGLERSAIIDRIADLAVAFGIEHSLDRYVADYSAGMIKKVAIAAAMIHSPRVLVLDEPFESVDPVSSATIIEILQQFVAGGGTVLLSSHSMELIERICDSVAIIVDGKILASGPMVDVVDGSTLEKRFVDLAGGSSAVQGMEWLQSFSE